MTLTRKARRNVETWKREIRAAGHAFQMGCWWAGSSSPYELRTCDTIFCIGGLAVHLFGFKYLTDILYINEDKLSRAQCTAIIDIRTTLYHVQRNPYRVKVWGRLPRGLKNYTDFDRIYPDPAVRAEKACTAIDRAVALIEGIIA